MGAKFLFSFLVIVLGVAGNPVGAQYRLDEKESFYAKSNRVILRLEHAERVRPDGSETVKEQYKPDGTAFFVQSEGELYVVSARHVVEKGYDLQAKVRSKDLRTGEIKVLHLNLPRDRWVFHSQQGNADTRYVDVAVMKINWMLGHQVMTFLYEVENGKEGSGNQLPYHDPEPPQPVLLFGFPSEIGFELTEQRPMGRLGIVSMVAGKKFLKMEGKFVEERACLVDIEAFPGNSGSPVINQFNRVSDPKIQLLGLLIGSNPRRHYAMIEPVSRIREALELARKQSSEEMEFWSLSGRN